MKLAPAALMAFFLGLGLIVFSFIWPSLVEKSAWSEEQAKEHSAASADLHRLAHMQGHPAGDAGHGEPGHAHSPAGASDQSSGPQAFEDAKARYQKSSDALAAAQSYYQGVAVWMKWIGIVLTLLGAGAYLVLVRAGD